MKQNIIDKVKNTEDSKYISVIDTYYFYKLKCLPKDKINKRKEWFLSVFPDETDETIIHKLLSKIKKRDNRKRKPAIVHINSQSYMQGAVRENISTILRLQDKQEYESVYYRVSDVRTELYKQYSYRRKWKYKELRKIVLDEEKSLGLRISSFLKTRLPYDKPDGILSYGRNLEVTLESMFNYLTEKARIYDRQREERKNRQGKSYKTSPANSQITGKIYPVIIHSR